MRRLLMGALLVLGGCYPCRQPDLCLPTVFIEEEPTQGEEVDIATWWEQFHDPLLNEFIERALCCNHDLRIAREKILEARGFYRAQFASLLPEVDAEVFYNRMRNSETLQDSPFLGGNFVTLYAAGFDASWEIDLFGKHLDYTRAECYEVASQFDEIRDVHVLVASEVATAYVTIRVLQDRIRIAKDHIENEEELLEVVTERYRTGISNALDVENSKALLEGRRSILPELQAELKAAIYGLAVLLGQIPESLDYLYEYEGKGDPIPFASGKIPLGLPSELLCRRGDVRAAEWKMRAAGARVCGARKEFFPTLHLFGDAGYASGFLSQWPKPGSRTVSFTPTLSLPFFHGGKILANVDIHTSLQRQASLEYEQTVLVALKEVESALVGYFKEGERVEAKTAQVEANTQARELSEILYLGGVVDFLNVVDAERALFVTHNQLAESKGRHMARLIAIYKALGGGWECCTSP